MQHIENELAEFFIEQGVLYFLYKAGVVLHIRAAKKIVADRLRLQQGKAYPVFCDARGIKSSDKEASEYLAKEGSALVKAVGILVESPITRTLTNFYLKLNKPLVPTQQFTDKNAALKYLEPYKS
jgi:hypothetical protein